jgi:tyrosine phenol-lyase
LAFPIRRIALMKNDDITTEALVEPYKIKVVEPIRLVSRERREQAIKEAGFNTFLLQSEDVFIDLLTDSGTPAMSDNQWAGMMLGDEAYAGSKNFTHLVQAVQEVLGYKFVVPTHQGRGAEHLMAKVLVKQGQIVPRNMYFTTSRAHVELCGGMMVDVICDIAHDPTARHPFKGNVDLDRLKALIEKEGPEKIAFISVEADVNMAGGQPVSLKNLRQVFELSRQYKIKVIMDATRSSENAYFIKEREEGQQDRSIREILKEMCSYTDGCAYSAKKDCLVNIGGFIATHDQQIFEGCRSLVVVYEGLHTYGGMAGRDMEAVARGLVEGTDEEYLRARISQVRYLGQRLLKAGVPIVEPPGGHAIFLDAIRFLPHIPREHFPAQALAAALYVESGVRAMERGAVSKGRDRVTGENIFPKLELVRLTIPRRVYTQSHIDFVADAVIRLFKKRNEIKGLRMVYEPKELRFFQARFEPT